MGALFLFLHQALEGFRTGHARQLLQQHALFAEGLLDSGLVIEDLLLAARQLLLSLDQAALFALQHIHFAVELLLSVQQTGFELAQGTPGALQLALERLALPPPLIPGLQTSGLLERCGLRSRLLDDLVRGRAGAVQFLAADALAAVPTGQKTEADGRHEQE